MTRLILFFAAWLIALLPFAGLARAKVVAIVFDTSGSMSDIYRLPAFGMQMLAGTVDGRAGADRLLTLTFEAYAENFVPFESLGPAGVARLPRVLTGAVQRHSITGATDHQRVVDFTRSDFRVRSPGRGTPYGPIEVMLDAAAKEARPGEEVVLVVISDGEYNDSALANGAGRAELARRFAQYRAAFPGPVRAEYLFIADPGRADALRSGIRAQGVRDALLTEFNGPTRRPDGELDGSWFVSDAGALWNALGDIVARVSGTDRAAQRALMQMAGNTITIDTPLSIARLVVVSTAEGTGRPAQLASTTFGKTPSEQRDLKALMPDSDTGLRAGPRNGAVRQMWFLDAVAPGRHTLTFDQPVNDNVFLLFQTAAIAQIQIVDPVDGRVLQPDQGTGRVRLTTGRAYQFVTRVLDGPGPAVVPLSGLPQGLSMTLDLAGPQARTEAMTLDVPADRGLGNWTAGPPGAYTARSQVRIPGFVSPWSNTLEIEVIDRVAQLTLSPIAPVTPCNSGGADDIVSGVTPGETETPVAEFEVSANANTDGAISFSQTRLPPGYELRDITTGQRVDPSATLPFRAGETRRFRVIRMGQATAEDIQAGAQALSINVQPVGDWVGDPVKADKSVALSVGNLEMKLVSVARAPANGPADTLQLSARDLSQGQLGASFSLVGLLEPPDPAMARERVVAGASGITGGFLGFEPILTGPGAAIHGLELRPSTRFLCLCGLGLENLIVGDDTRTVAVSYTDRTGLQRANATLQLSIPVPGGALSISCVANAVILLLIAMFLRGIVALFTTKRFPRGSVVEIIDSGPVPRFQRLDKGNTVFLKAWFALFTGNPDEVRVVEGLRLRAASSGAILDLRKSAPPWTLERMGESFAEMKRVRPNLQDYKLIWGDLLQSDLSPNLSVRLKKRAGDV